jgi:SNF2 family DNA or RNA helicase
MSACTVIGASRLIQLDSDWNPSNDLQAMARYGVSLH